METDLSRKLNAAVKQYVKGKPDTPEWRKAFADLGWQKEGEEFVSVGGRIYPVNFIREARIRGFKLPEGLEGYE